MSERFVEFVSAAPDAAAAVSGDLLALVRGGITYQLDATYYAVAGSTGDVMGSGTAGTVPVWTASATLGNSHITDITVSGVTIAPVSGGFILGTGGSSVSATGGDVGLIGGSGGVSGGVATFEGGASEAVGGAALIHGGSGGTSFGGYIDIIGGASTSAAGGDVYMAGGDGATAGGSATISAGSGTLAGGRVSISAGLAGSSGGSLNLGAGDGVSGGGNVTIDAGSGSTPGVQGSVQMTGGGFLISAGPGTTSGYNVIVNAGSGFAALPGGAATFKAGPGGAGSGGDGGTAFLQGGAGGSGGKDGNVELLAGSGGVSVTSGGNVVLTAGVGSSVNGMVINRGPLLVRQGTPTAKTTSATLTAAEVLAGIITVNQGGGGASALQLPAASAMDTALPQSQAEDAFDFSLVNISTVAAEDATVTTNTNWTLVGSMVVESNDSVRAASSGRFRARKTGSAAWTLYRMA